MKTKYENEYCKLYDLKEVSELWNLSVWTVRGLIEKGQVRPIVGVGRGFKFTGDELDPDKLERL